MRFMFFRTKHDTLYVLIWLSDIGNVGIRCGPHIVAANACALTLFLARVWWAVRMANSFAGRTWYGRRFANQQGPLAVCVRWLIARMSCQQVLHTRCVFCWREVVNMSTSPLAPLHKQQHTSLLEVTLFCYRRRNSRSMTGFNNTNVTRTIMNTSGVSAAWRQCTMNFVGSATN